MEFFFRFMLYGVSGLSIETIFRSLLHTLKYRTVFLSFPPLVMFLVYGASVFLFEPIHTYFRDFGFPLLLRLSLYLPGLYVVELAAGLLILKITGRYAWRYDGRWQFAHLINFSYAPFWIVFLTLWEQLHRTIDTLFNLNFVA